VIVLDTHALIWWVNGDVQLSAKARKAIQREISSEEGQVFISAITTWEIALLIHKGRLTLTMDVNDWIDTVAAIEGVRFVPIDNEIAIQSVRLPGDFHADPADRMIVALARHLSVSLVTSDAMIRAYKHVKTIW
jgi:PIN domain nuclease of toxin-antitoxin system